MDVIDIAALDAVELLEAFAQGRMTPLQALQGVTERIARRNPEINAFAAMNPAALNAARESTLRWQDGQARALEGVPVTVSDLVDVAGLPTRRGSKTTDAEAVRRDAPIIAVLRAAGAVIIGKTNVSEFGWTYQGDSPLSGIIRNPWNILYTAGGPSGGAAAAAAGFFAPLHVADGDVCVAASWCGVVGLKLGTMSENQGITARSVADISLFSAVLKGQAPDETLGAGVQGLKIGLLRTPGFAAPATDIAWNAVATAKGILQDQGAELSEIAPSLPEIDKIYTSLWGAKRVKDVGQVVVAQQTLLDPGLLALTNRLEAKAPPSEQELEAACAYAVQSMAAVEADVILCPVVPHGAPLAAATTLDPLVALAQDWAPWSMLFNVTGQPALTIPVGVDADGLPVSVLIVARAGGDEAALLRVARALEQGLE